MRQREEMFSVPWYDNRGVTVAMIGCITATLLFFAITVILAMSCLSWRTCDTKQVLDGMDVCR